MNRARWLVTIFIISFSLLGPKIECESGTGW